MNQFTPQIGDVYMMEFSGTFHEQSGARPGLVIQNNIGNKYSPNIIVIPLSTVLKKTNQPTHVVLRAAATGLRFDSMAICESPQRMAKEYVGKFLTRLDHKTMARIAVAYALASSIFSFLSFEELVETWQQSCRMNVSCE